MNSSSGLLQPPDAAATMGVGVQRNSKSALCCFLPAVFLPAVLSTYMEQTLCPTPYPSPRASSSLQDPIPFLHLLYSKPLASALFPCLVKARKTRDGTQGERWWEHVGAEVLSPQSMHNSTCAPAGVSGLSFAPDAACSGLAHSPAGRQKKCNGLNEKCPQRLWHLSTWFPVVGTIWGGLGGVAILEEVHHWGAGSEASKASHHSQRCFSASCLLFKM